MMIHKMMGGLLIMAGFFSQSTQAYITKAYYEQLKQTRALAPEDRVKLEEFFSKHAGLYTLLTNSEKLPSIVGWHAPYATDCIELVSRLQSLYAQENATTLLEQYMVCDKYFWTIYEEYFKNALFVDGEHMYVQKQPTLQKISPFDLMRFNALLLERFGCLASFKLAGGAVLKPIDDKLCHNVVLDMSFLGLNYVLFGSILDWPTQPQVLSRVILSEKARLVIENLKVQYEQQVYFYVPRHYIYNDDIVLAEKINNLMPFTNEHFDLCSESKPFFRAQMQALIGTGLWDVCDDEKGILKNIFWGDHPERPDERVVVLLDFEMPSVAGKHTDTDRVRCFPDMWDKVEALALRKFDKYCEKRNTAEQGPAA